MKFSIEKKISNFIENQFPSFYQTEGENFILFMKAYYEWMESSGNPIGEARNLLDYSDIDNTPDQFLEHFQQKYLYGIPFNVIINKRYLLKHILDVYRSKGTIQCYKLLFKLIYNEDIDVYLPGRDILKPSDGTWIEPKYLEVSSNDKVKDYIGKRIVGASSNTVATVESFIVEPVNQNILSTVYISNISPQGGAFIEGEKIVLEGQTSNTDAVSTAPTILGSFNTLNIINGGADFSVGDILKIAHRDVDTNEVISSGVDGLMRVTEVSKGKGQLNFTITNPGFGITQNALTFLYKDPTDPTGGNANFKVGSISYTQTIQYNTDLIANYLDTQINSSTYGFPANTSANSATPLQNTFSYANDVFGTLTALTGVKTGNGFTKSTFNFIRSPQTSNNLPGTITYSTSSNTVTISGGDFTRYFANDDLIWLKANNSLLTSIEYQVIKEVTNSTSMVLYGPPSYSSTASAKYRIAPAILPSNFALTEPVMFRADGTVDGLNSIVTTTPSAGNNLVSKVEAINSGKGYNSGEIVEVYRFGGLTTPAIAAGGVGYSNTDQIIFSGGGLQVSPAKATLQTDNNGTITHITVLYAGSGYVSPPNIIIRTKTGTGAKLESEVVEFNTESEVQGSIVKTGIGKKFGYWSTTRGFLNSDKYIQDSYFYQDFSYQIKVASTLDKYKNVLYNTFHTAGAELFGQFSLSVVESSLVDILYDTIIPEPAYILIDQVLDIMTDETGADIFIQETL